MQYEIRSPTGRRPSIAFACPACTTPLLAGLHDAGTRDTCPHCHAAFVVPGREEAQRVIAARIATTRRSRQSAPDASSSSVPRSHPSHSTPPATESPASVRTHRPRQGLGDHAQTILSILLLLPATTLTPRGTPAGRINDIRARTAYPTLRSLIFILTITQILATMTGITLALVPAAYALIDLAGGGGSAVLNLSLMIVFLTLAIGVWALGALVIHITHESLNLIIDIPDILLHTRDVSMPKAHAQSPSDREITPDIAHS